MKGQRDKLLQMKQKEREKQLQDFEEKDCKRPQSATAARKVGVGVSSLLGVISEFGSIKGVRTGGVVLLSCVLLSNLILNLCMNE